MINCNSIKVFLLLGVFAAFAGTCITGCEEPSKPDTCTPCGDFMLPCLEEDLGCPVCSSLDIGTSGIIVGYANGSYFTTQNNVTVFYKADGTVCYRAEVDTLSEELTYIVDEESYTVQDDGTWTCPDGSTWTFPADCNPDEFENVPGSDDYLDGESWCPSVFELPACDIDTTA